MQFIVSAVSDVGTTRVQNEDSVAIYEYETNIGRICLAMVCDGVGGLSNGKYASETVCKLMKEWFDNELISILQETVEDYKIRKSWEKFSGWANDVIKEYGIAQHKNLGTTVATILITSDRYYILNIGDSRIYQLTNDYVRQITEDQTLVHREVKNGILTEEQAKSDRRRNILLQCLGVQEEVVPDLYFGVPQKEMVFVLCSDGLYHHTDLEELREFFSPQIVNCEDDIIENAINLIDLVKCRGEKDNISIVVVKIK